MMAAFVAILLGASVYAYAQSGQANRVVPVTPANPAPSSDFWTKLLRPMEPETPEQISPRLRFHEYVYDTVGPTVWLREGAAAGISQAMNSPHEWGGGMEGFGKRFGSNMATLVVHNTITYGLSAALHEDNRYLASSKSRTMARAWHAILSPFEARHDDGRFGFSYSNVGGVVGASLISRTWSPPSWQGGGDIARGIGYTLAGEAAFNVFREFLPDLLHHRQ